ncbi:MAG: DUF4105 domain-containing protein [Leptospiraceae bacterium]
MPARNILTFIFLLSLSPQYLLAETLYTPEQLRRWAINGNLHRSAYWHKLLGYKQEPFSYESATDGKSFFFSAEGYRNPEAEIIATLEAFLRPVPDNSDNHPICRFPARFHWLTETLSLDRNRFPSPSCEEYNEFAQHLKADSLSYVFASYYSGHPASLFGHTFLKFNQTDSSDVSVVAADPSISYGARVTSTNPMIYFLDGMFGGFDGTLELQPFKNHLQAYTEGEQRDLWEFKLNLRKEEIDQLIRAAWEMNSTHYDYYFLSENCSYRLLNLLELARPGLNLADSYFWNVHPADTVKQVVDGKEMARSLIFYSATETRYRKKVLLLSDEGKEAMLALSNSENPQMENLSIQEKALVYEVAADRVLLQADGNGSLTEEKKQLLRSLLDTRASRFTGNLPKYEVFPEGRNPLIGHESTLFSVSGGQSSLGSFSEFRFRPALHDLHDRARGYSPYGELEFFTLRLRAYSEESRIELEDFVLMNMMSMDPVTTGLWPLSWEVKMGVRSLASSLYQKEFQPEYLEELTFFSNQKTDPYHHAAYATMRGGYSWEPDLGLDEGSILFYGLAGISVESGQGISSQLVPSVRTGILIRPFSVWSLRLDYVGAYYSDDSLARDRLDFYSNLAITRSFALELGYRGHPDNGYSEAHASIKYYF